MHCDFSREKDSDWNMSKDEAHGEAVSDSAWGKELLRTFYFGKRTTYVLRCVWQGETKTEAVLV